MSMEFGYGDWKSEFKHRRKPTRNCDQIVKSGETSVEPNWAAKSAQGVKDHGTRRHRRSNEHRAAAWFLIIVGVVAGASFYTIVTREISPTQLQQRQNKRASAKWRRAVQANCMRFLDTLRNQSDWTSEAAQKQKNRIDQWALNQFRFIDPSESQTAQESMPCRYAFLDWGLRDVQALGDWVELAMDACTPIWNVLQPELSWTHPEMPRPRFELSRMQVLAADSVTSSSLPFATPLRRYLHDWLWKPRASRSKPPTILPEEICMLGIGSDHSEFNELMRLERFIAGIQPPLFRSFEMEKVDKVQLNVVKKKTLNRQAMVFTDLLRRKMLPLQPISQSPKSRSKKEIQDGFLMIRMELDESTSQLLQHEQTVHVLCRYRQMKNAVTVLLESGRTRSQDIPAFANLDDCGVDFIYIDKE